MTAVARARAAREQQRDEDNSKGNSGENGEGVATTDAASLILSYYFFWGSQDTVTRLVFLLDT